VPCSTNNQLILTILSPLSFCDGGLFLQIFIKHCDFLSNIINLGSLPFHIIKARTEVLFMKRNTRHHAYWDSLKPMGMLILLIVQGMHQNLLYCGRLYYSDPCRCWCITFVREIFDIYCRVNKKVAYPQRIGYRIYSRQFKFSFVWHFTA